MPILFDIAGKRCASARYEISRVTILEGVWGNHFWATKDGSLGFPSRKPYWKMLRFSKLIEYQRKEKIKSIAGTQRASMLYEISRAAFLEGARGNHSLVTKDGSIWVPFEKAVLENAAVF